MNDALYEYEDSGLIFRLSKSGVLSVETSQTIVSVSWFQEVSTGKPWMPAKFKAFKSTIKQMVKDGDFNHLKKHNPKQGA